jgi:murein DD-endopeptidase MepM/ murein hydrolase activator NlpD
VAGKVNIYFQSGHQAIDIEANCGTPVGAAHGGSAIFSGWKDNGGGYVVDIAGAGFVTTYNHLSAVAIGVGAPVTTGQLIGYSGMTGIATGCHLHFGVIVNGVPVDP